MFNLIIPSQHFMDSPKTVNAQLVGQKANSLWDLPIEWVPPFFVVSTDAFKQWVQNESSYSSWLEPLLTIIYQGLKSKFSFDKLIVRSSGIAEMLEDRGEYDSFVCDTISSQLVQKVVDIWKQARDKNNCDFGIAVIVQIYVKPLALGHLSNERRVVRLPHIWVCEYELFNDDHEFKWEKVVCDKSGFHDDPTPLLCKDNKELLLSLKCICNYSHLGTRNHYEWVWDGKRLWIVQKDIEVEKEGTSPGAEWKSKQAEQPSALSFFVDGLDSKGNWHKIDCLRDFSYCQLPVAQVHVLEDTCTLDELSKGQICDLLKADLSQLTKYPIIIRTDVMESVKSDSLLLPRTDAIATLEDAETFLINTSKELVSQGLKPGQFCFIAHRFIVSRSASMSYSRPESPSVLIDGIWGLPDGLLFYTHDSYQVDIDHKKIVDKLIRCKTDYLDVNVNGIFVKKSSGVPWDWKESLFESELLIIGEFTWKLAKHLDCPVQVMFFSVQTQILDIQNACHGIIRN